jgi:glycopeptide antibiotics resistance protein
MVLLYYLFCSWKNKLTIGITVAFFCSILTESLQAILPLGRQAEWLDLAANTTGIVISALIIHLYMKRKN